MANQFRSVAIDLTAASPYGSSAVTWVETTPAGTSVSVESSIDGVTYSAVTNGGAIPGLSASDPLEDVYLIFRITLVESGNDTPEIRNLAAYVGPTPAGGDNLDTEKNYYKFGYVKWLSGDNQGLSMEVKEWLSASDKVSLFLAMSSTVRVGDVFEVTPGCDRSIGTCFAKFDNVLNFRGEPYIPGQDALLRVVSQNHQPLDPTSAWGGAQVRPTLDVNDP